MIETVLDNPLASGMEALAKIAHLQQEHLHKSIAVGMSVVAKVAKKYQFYGIPGGDRDMFKLTKTAYSPRRQKLRLLKSVVNSTEQRCPRCNKPFLGPLREVCMCTRCEMAGERMRQ